MTPETLKAAARQNALDVFGNVSAMERDGLGEGAIALLGPHEPGFWAHVTAEPEFTDGAPDPLDRWSRRVVGGIAAKLGGTALFPFGDLVRPFIDWALRSGRAWQSPVGLLVHEDAGLMVSYRGAVFLPGVAASVPTGGKPCATCAAPCLDACPVGALSRQGYDLERCHSFLDTVDGKDCMSRGCAVRRSCPVSQNYGRSDQQSAFHMERFHPCR